MSHETHSSESESSSKSSGSTIYLWVMFIALFLFKLSGCGWVANKQADSLPCLDEKITNIEQNITTNELQPGMERNLVVDKTNHKFQIPKGATVDLETYCGDTLKLIRLEDGKEFYVTQRNKFVGEAPRGGTKGFKVTLGEYCHRQKTYLKLTCRN